MNDVSTKQTKKNKLIQGKSGNEGKIKVKGSS